MKNVSRKLIGIGVVVSLGSTFSLAIPPRQTVVHREAKPTKYLVLDSRIIDNVQNAKLTLGETKKHPANPLFGEDKLWEPRFDNLYANVIYDEEDKLYKCWYSPFIVDERTTLTPEEERHPFYTPYLKKKPMGRETGICYATSKDGLKWDKPELGLIEFEGNKNNNILNRGYHGAAIFKDTHESDPAKRYKMIFKGDGADDGMAVSFSADGLRWSEPIECPEIDAGGDTHNVALWAPDIGKYVVITRINGSNNVRKVARTESKDFVKWTKAKVILEGPDPLKQTHDMVVFPTGGVYLGLLGVMEFIDKSNYNIKQHIELAWSPDTKTWYRIEEGKPLIANSSAEKEHYGYTPYDFGTAFASAPIFLEDEVRIYYGSSDWYFMDWRKGYLALATLRPDGWAGYEQVSTDAPAVITTMAVAGDLASLSITADVQNGGSVIVTVVDEYGEELAHSEPIVNTVTGARIKWKDDVRSLTSVYDGKARLKFTLINAKLYSFETK
jgi:hypothetical protein